MLYNRNSTKGGLGAVMIITVPLLFSSPAIAKRNLLSLSLEELMSVKVTSVSKKSQSILHAAAAVHVITADEIRRSGMTTIPELLRMVPGIQVSQIDSHTWGVSSRGFHTNGKTNKLLVLMDGRSVYTPVYSGVYWDVQHTPLEDIERIEVIRGPGGTLWGANAVNGVVNIITKSSRNTKGSFVTVRGGDHQNEVTVRAGKQVTKNGTGRFYLNHRDNDGFTLSNGGDKNDQWDSSQIGFRTDWDLGDQKTLTVQGDLYRMDQQDGTTAGKNEGSNLLVRFKQQYAQDASWELQGFHDIAERKDAALSHLRVETIDVEYQHQLRVNPANELTFGGGYRKIKDGISGVSSVSFDPSSFDQEVLNAFIQNEITLEKDLKLTLGSKFERNDFTGTEIQPNARLLWEMDSTQTLWGAISRAVRTPSRSNRDLIVTAGPTTVNPPYSPNNP